MNIGQRIKERRKALKMSANDLGKRLGKDRSTIYRYENGEIENLPIDFLEPIAVALKTTPAYLMGWEAPTKATVLTLSSHEEKLITAYRNQPDIQPAVDRLLKIEEPTLRMIPTEPAQEQAKIVAFGGAKETVTPSGTYQERKALLRNIADIESQIDNEQDDN